jgi:hypothetical protein
MGFPVQDTDKDGREEFVPRFDLPETGHHVSIGHSRKNQTWVAQVSHPDDNGPDKTIATINLGLNHEHVPHLLTHEMGRQPVTGEMMRQWRRAQGPRYEWPNGRRRLNGRPAQPHVVHVVARGAQMPEDGDDW